MRRCLCLVYWSFTIFGGLIPDKPGIRVFDLPTIGVQIAERRRALGLRQVDLARQAGVGRATVEALENGRLRELGSVKLSRILAALGIELALDESKKRKPTLEDLLREDEHDQGLGGRR